MDGLPNIKPLNIGSVARLAGVPLTTVRFYERAKIVRPAGRSGANYRLYSPDAVARIRFTRRAQELGFTLREVKEVLDLRADGRSNCKRVRATASAKIDDINARIRSLRRIGRALEKLAIGWNLQNHLSVENHVIRIFDLDAPSQLANSLSSHAFGMSGKSSLDRREFSCP